jgi:GH25 family lysozyme M1 (1,4-beta-N-acetylmuramidase)
MSTYKIIDLSEHNAVVDFNALEVDGVILRVGYRGYGDDGRIILDKKFKRYVQSANESNIPVGVYFCSQAVTQAEAIKEAKYVIKNIKDYKIDLPVYFAVEYAERNGCYIGRLYKSYISREKQTRLAKSFCDTLNRNGYNAGVFTNYDFYRTKININSLAGYSMWIACYINDLPISADMWQYTDDGKIAGVTGMVNLNYMYID